MIMASNVAVDDFPEEISNSESNGDQSEEDYFSDDRTDDAAPGKLKFEEVGPYLYEPVASNSDDFGEKPENRPDRIERLSVDKIDEWCSCTNCQILDTEPECCCCHEIGPVNNKLVELQESSNTDIQCITNTEPFESICLNPFVLEVAWMAYKNRYGHKTLHRNQPEIYRHTAYRQFVRWCWGYCGRKNRHILPSCVVSCIRAHFQPDNGDEEQHIYRGFRVPVLE